MPCRATWGGARVSQEAEEPEEARLREFTVVSTGRNGRGKVDKFEKAWDWNVGISAACSGLYG